MKALFGGGKKKPQAVPQANPTETIGKLDN